MDNGQTPGGNTTTAGAVEGLARRIADQTIPEDSDAYDTHEARMADWYVARDAALATIETMAEAVTCLELIADGDGDPVIMARQTLDHLKGPKP